MLHENRPGGQGACMVTAHTSVDTAPEPADAMAAAVVVNGRAVPLAGVPLHTSLLDLVRGAGLTGSKEGCAEGECGACSVLIARPGTSTKTEWTALNACLVPAAAFDGQEIVTAEGLGTPEALHPVQQEMAARGGSQCGYCTPGFVCSMAAEYYRPDRAAGAGEHDGMCGANGFDLHALSGNLCRCTGYRPIRDAAFALAEPAAGDAFAARRAAAAPAARPTELSHDGAEFRRPATLAEALDGLHARPDLTVVAGSTDWGVEVNLRGTRAQSVMAIDRLPELRTFDVRDDVLEIGAALTLTEIERRLGGRVPLLDQLWPQFASRLIRNGATLGGNLGTGSPIGDSAPVLLALDATVALASAASAADGAVRERDVSLADYFLGYRQSVRRPDELIRAVRIPVPVAPVAAFHKIAKRRFDDISSVAVAFALDVVDGVVRTARIGVGGAAATPIRARDTEAALTGQPWDADTVARASDVLRREGTPLDDHRASAAYRSAMLATSLRKLYAQHAGEAVA
jgi:xanthine dehydrogenase small subunit